jgi:hypothetical protein
LASQDDDDPLSELGFFIYFHIPSHAIFSQNEVLVWYFYTQTSLFQEEKKKEFYFHIERGIEYGGEWINKSERESVVDLFLVSMMK